MTSIKIWDSRNDTPIVLGCICITSANLLIVQSPDIRFSHESKSRRFQICVRMCVWLCAYTHGISHRFSLPCPAFSIPESTSRRFQFKLRPIRLNVGITSRLDVLISYIFTSPLPICSSSRVRHKMSSESKFRGFLILLISLTLNLMITHIYTSLPQSPHDLGSQGSNDELNDELKSKMKILMFNKVPSNCIWGSHNWLDSGITLVQKLLLRISSSSKIWMTDTHIHTHTHTHLCQSPHHLGSE